MIKDNPINLPKIDTMCDYN